MGTALPTRADGSAARVEYLTQVAEGQRPRLRLQAQVPLSDLAIELDAPGVAPVRVRFGPLSRGTTREVALSSAPGRRRYQGKLVVTRGRVVETVDLAFDALVAPPLRLHVERARVDLDAGTLELSASRPLARVEVEAKAASGARVDAAVLEAAELEPGEGVGTVRVRWSPSPEVARLDLRATDVDGFWAGLSLVPWSVHVPHEEVLFATESAAIAPAELPKLRASAERIAAAVRAHRELGPIALFVAGHTDTQGSAAHNRELSLARARAIAAQLAALLRERGVRLPIAYEGFGEHAPRVPTPDETDEPRNRRADYILAIEPPALRAADGFAPRWRKLE